jgi:hypothetical protein
MDQLKRVVTGTASGDCGASGKELWLPETGTDAVLDIGKRPANS